MQAGKGGVAGIIRSLLSLIRKGPEEKERPSVQPAGKKRRKRQGIWRADKSKPEDNLPAEHTNRTAEESRQADQPIFLETNIDKLYALIKERKSIVIDDAAKKFGVTEQLMEEWCRMLEEHGMIELHYPAFGKPEIRIRKSERKYVSSHAV